MKIAIGNDQHGLIYKQAIMEAFPEHEWLDCGTFNNDPISYPSIAEKVGIKVSNKECERGILICGTGIGMAICANKIPGCYAAVCHDVYSTQRSILSNNGNILCFGALVIGKQTCLTLTKEWLSLRFDTSSHSMANVKNIHTLEESFISR